MKLEYPQRNGTTLREHLEQVERQTGHRDPLLDSVQVPEGGEWIWTIYWRLRKEQSLSYQDIDAFCRVTGEQLATWEVEALFAMDQAVTGYIGEITRNA